MDFSPILAHGVLGNYDELIYLGIAVVFLVMVAMSWFQARTDQDEEEGLHGQPVTNKPESEQGDHLPLE